MLQWHAGNVACKLLMMVSISFKMYLYLCWILKCICICAYTILMMMSPFVSTLLALFHIMVNNCLGCSLVSC